MAHTLRFDNTSCSIADYLVVHPFAFNALGQLQIEPHRASAFFNLVTTRVQHQQGRQRETAELPDFGDFEIWNNEERILCLSQFDVRIASTPASLDMGRATWVMRGMQVPDVNIAFTPIHSIYNLFAVDQGHTSYWGAEVGEALRASLSVPVYGWQGDQYVAEYFALGPANSAPSGASSLFDWVVSRGAPPSPANQGVDPTPSGVLDLLRVQDLKTGETNDFFGDGPGGIAQVAGGVSATTGAVFVVNGAILETEWRSLATLIREIATVGVSDGDIIRLMERFPVSKLDQTVRATASPETRVSGEFAINTSDFEGIALWNLNMRDGDGPVTPMHR